MQHQEFKEWLEQNTRGHEIFIIKAMESRKEKNKKRTGKTKKWTDKQMERQVETPTSKSKHTKVFLNLMGIKYG